MLNKVLIYTLETISQDECFHRDFYHKGYKKKTLERVSNNTKHSWTKTSLTNSVQQLANNFHKTYELQGVKEAT